MTTVIERITGLQEGDQALTPDMEDVLEALRGRIGVVVEVDFHGGLWLKYEGDDEPYYVFLNQTWILEKL